MVVNTRRKADRKYRLPGSTTETDQQAKGQRVQPEIGSGTSEDDCQQASQGNGEPGGLGEHSGQDENERHQPVGEEADGNDGMNIVEADDPALEAEVDEAGSQQDLEVSREREGGLHQVQIWN